MWEISVGDQLLTVVYSICLGIILCVCYDVLRAFRRAMGSGAVAIFIGDIFYFIISAFAVFLFLLARTNGEIRGYVLVCALSGFVLCRVTLSRVLIIPVTFLLSFVVRFLRMLGYYILKFLFSFGDYLMRFSKKSLKKAKCALKTLKKLLKSTRQLLYTKQNKRNMGD